MEITNNQTYKKALIYSTGIHTKHGRRKKNSDRINSIVIISEYFRATGPMYFFLSSLLLLPPATTGSVWHLPVSIPNLRV